METEEDLYNEIFKALKHPVRRHILSLLQDEPQSYSSILRALNIDTGLLNYHLENLGSLIAKDGEGRYGVSEFGRAAIRLKDGIEAPHKHEQTQLKIRRKEVYLVVIALFSLIMLGSSILEYRQMYLREIEWDDTVLTKVLITEQNRLPRIESILDEMIDDESIKADQVEKLITEAGRASQNYARIVYVDEPHLELWSGASEAFTLLDDLLTDMKLYTDGGSNDSIPLDRTGLEKLQALRDGVRELGSVMFPVNISREMNPWTDHSYGNDNDAANIVESLKESIAQSWVILSRVSVAPSPEEQATAMLIEAVGQDYYNEYFSFRGISINVAHVDWLTCVNYDYLVSGDDYNYTCEVRIYFDKANGYVKSTGVPRVGNLMPFMVNRAEALGIAESASDREAYEEEVSIAWLGELSGGGSLQKYVWVVDLYNDPRGQAYGSFTRAIIDPLNGELLESYVISWLSTP